MTTKTILRLLPASLVWCGAALASLFGHTILAGALDRAARRIEGRPC